MHRECPLKTEAPGHSRASSTSVVEVAESVTTGMKIIVGHQQKSTQEA